MPSRGRSRWDGCQANKCVRCGLLFENFQPTGESPALANVPPGVWPPFFTPGQTIGLWTDFRAKVAKIG